MFEMGGGFIQDRSIYEDTGIFAKMHADKGTMDPIDYQTYTELFEAMVMTPYFPHPHLLIYLDGTLEDVIQRINQRGRSMELETPTTYWEEMHERYVNWIENFDACPVLRLNINDYDLVGHPEQIESIIEQVAKTMKK